MRYVFDTSAFTSLGCSAKDNMKCIKLMAKCMNARKGDQYLMPKTVWPELENMLTNKGFTPKEVNAIGEILTLRQPSRMEMLIPAQFVNDYVLELRERVNKGLRAAEKAVLEKSKNHDRPDHEVIADLRDDYRDVMRRGMLDSEEDLDVILLAKEAGATIVARDEGIEKWADKWGVHYVRADRFFDHVKR